MTQRLEQGDRVPGLVTEFLDRHRERIMGCLEESLPPSRRGLVRGHRAMLDLAVDHLRGMPEGQIVQEVRRRMAAAGSEIDPRALLPGQMTLWTTVHRMVREVDGPHRHLSVLHAALALTGDAMDRLNGALIDLAHSGERACSSPNSLLEMGRTHREFLTLCGITRDVLDAKDPGHMFQILEERILESFHLRSLVIASVNRQEGFVELVRSYPDSPASSVIGWRLDMDHPDILCDVARTGRMEVIDGWDPRYYERITGEDGTISFRHRPLDHNFGQTAFFVPILVRDSAMGVIATASNLEGKAVVLREVERMRPFLDMAGTALSHIFEGFQRRRAEEALWKAEERLRQGQKMEAIGRLAGGIAHDFNNVLQVITGFSELSLKQIRTDSPLRADIEEIRKAGVRAANLVHQLLAFSRKQVLAFRALDLNEVVTGVDHILHRLIGEDIDMVTTLGEGLWPVWADLTQVEQVVMNLALNARDAMPEGGRLRIETGNVEVDQATRSAHPDVSPGAYATLVVTDTGVGMDEETLGRIFEPFFTTKEAGRGTGLGLATVHGIVAESGGALTVSSRVGAGTTFRVYLPRATESLGVREPDPVGREMPRGSETVLLVEDEEMVRAHLGTVLRMCGYRVLEARHGAEGLLAHRQHSGPIHLMVTDVVMPEMNGRDLAGHLARERPETKVIFMSGYTSPGDNQPGSPGGEVLQKPFTPDTLARRVRETLDRQG